MRRTGTHRMSRVIGGALGVLVCVTATGFTLAGTQPASATGTCQANMTYSVPPILSLTSTPAGLYLQDDGISTYGVGGNSVQVVRDALNMCAPTFIGSSRSAEFLAYTSYALNWAYDKAIQSDGTCRLSNVKVGLHLSQLEPDLLHKATATPELQQKWTSFSASLQRHENGHKLLDIAGAQSLLHSLTNLHAQCASISASAASVTDAVFRSIVSANTAHDTETSNGRDQGASW